MAKIDVNRSRMSRQTELAERAPQRHCVRVRMLGLMPKRGRCAEIGVWDGKFSQVILDETDPVELVLIDPWDLLAEGGEESFVHSKWGDTGQMGAMHSEVAAAYGHLPQVDLRKGYSVPVLESYPDGYFNWIYIDGNHRYEHVLADLRIAARKLRTGGIIAGDDFFWKQDGRQHVRDAVLDFLQERQLRRGRCGRCPRTGRLKAPVKRALAARSAVHDPGGRGAEGAALKAGGRRTCRARPGEDDDSCSA